MDDPLMLATATTLVAWTTTELAQGARSALADLIEMLRRRFRLEPADQEMLDVALREQTPEAVHRLAALLEHETLRDSAFGAEFAARFAQIDALVGANRGNVTNAVAGDVSGTVVQARDVHGGISFGDANRS